MHEDPLDCHHIGTVFVDQLLQRLVDQTEAGRQRPVTEPQGTTCHVGGLAPDRVDNTVAGDTGTWIYANNPAQQPTRQPARGRSDSEQIGRNSRITAPLPGNFLSNSWLFKQLFRQIGVGVDTLHIVQLFKHVEQTQHLAPILLLHAGGRVRSHRHLDLRQLKPATL